MKADFEPHIAQSTIIYNANGEVIDTLEGHVTVNPKDYDDYMPIEYRHVTVTTQTERLFKIEKGAEK